MHFYKKPADRKRYENLRIPYKIEPLEGESLTSYLIRVANAFYCSPTSFYYLYFPEYFKDKVIFRRDMDIWVDKDFIIKLSDKTRVSFEKLWQTSLKSYEGYLFERCRGNTTTFMIDAVSVRGSVCNGYGYKICPECLRGSKIPYLRKIWRVSFYTACLSHKTFLIDRCPKCNTSITPFKPSKDEILFACYKCNFNFKEAKAIKVPNDSYGIKAVEKLTIVLENGYFSWSNNYYTYSIGFFIVVRQLIKLLKNLARKRIIHESEVLRNEILFNTELYQKVRENLFQKKEIERSSLFEKYFLFSIALNLLEDYPYRLREFLNKHKLRYSLLIRDFLNEKDIPFFYFTEISQYKNSYSEAMSQEEFESALKLLRRKGYVSNLTNLEKVFGIKYKPKTNTRNYYIYQSMKNL